MGPTWGPPGSCRPHVCPMNLAIRGVNENSINSLGISSVRWNTPVCPPNWHCHSSYRCIGAKIGTRASATAMLTQQWFHVLHGNNTKHVPTTFQPLSKLYIMFKRGEHLLLLGWSFHCDNSLWCFLWGVYVDKSVCPGRQLFHVAGNLNCRGWRPLGLVTYSLTTRTLWILDIPYGENLPVLTMQIHVQLSLETFLTLWTDCMVLFEPHSMRLHIFQKRIVC